MYHSLDKRGWFTIIPFKESLTMFQIWIFFAIPSLILSHLDVPIIELPRLTPNVLKGTCIVSFVLVDQFYFYKHHPVRFDFFKSLLLS